MNLVKYKKNVCVPMKEDTVSHMLNDGDGNS